MSPSLSSQSSAEGRGRDSPSFTRGGSVSSGSLSRQRSTTVAPGAGESRCIGLRDRCLGDPLQTPTLTMSRRSPAPDSPPTPLQLPEGLPASRLPAPFPFSPAAGTPATADVRRVACRET